MLELYVTVLSWGFSSSSSSDMLSVTAPFEFLVKGGSDVTDVDYQFSDVAQLFRVEPDFGVETS
jgi:hypothetical protein